MNEDDVEWALKTALDILEEQTPNYDTSEEIGQILDIYHANFD